MTSLVPIFLVARWAEASWRVRAPGTEVWGTILVAGLLSFSIVAADLEVPTLAVGLPEDIEPVEPGQSTVILDRDGRVLARLDESFDRRVVPADELPRPLRLAVVAIEDDTFFEHDGIRPLAIARAFVANLSQGQVEQGGSTITQQFVRGAYEEVGRERSIGRKLREAAAAVRVEQTMSKDEILTAYLNRVYLGRGAYGADAAARAYFGRPARRLDLARSAFLAGLMHAPVAYQDRPKAARLRRNLVLDRMADLGFIAARRARRAKAHPLDLRSPARSIKAPYFIEYVRQVLLAPRSAGGFGMSDEEVTRGGYRIHTTLDLRMQRAAERAVRSVADRRDDPEVALVSMTTGGAVRAMIGGRGQRPARARGFNFAVQRSPSGGRLPGSTFKPFALAAYLEQGGDLLDSFSAPSTTTVPECRGPDGGPWRPSNYDGRSYGWIDTISATVSSVNTAYAQIAAEAGPARVAAMAERAGIESPLSAVCSIALGTSGVTPLEMARAYATFAARGVRPDVHAIRSIGGPEGEQIERHEPSRERVMERELADTVNAVLERVVEQGTGTPAAIDRPAAGKTGTSEEERDLWFVGYTPHPGLSTAVWVGHRDENGAVPPPVAATYDRPATGGGFAGAIWQLFMLEALEDMADRTFEDVMLYPPPPEDKKDERGRDRDGTNDPTSTASRDEDGTKED